MPCHQINDAIQFQKRGGIRLLAAVMFFQDPKQDPFYPHFLEENFLNRDMRDARDVIIIAYMDVGNTNIVVWFDGLVYILFLGVCHAMSYSLEVMLKGSEKSSSTTGAPVKNQTNTSAWAWA